MRKRHTKRKPHFKRKTKKIRGGTTTPFSELGSIFSGIGNSVQNMISSFTVTPSAYTPAYNPSISKQFLMPPTTQTLNHIYKSSYGN